MRLLQNIQHYDLLTFTWCLHCKHRTSMVILSRYISRSADGPLYLFCALLMAYYNYRTAVYGLLAGFAIERVTYLTTKQSFRRNRPPQIIPGYQSVIQPSDKFSFPSGHTSAAFLIAGVVSHHFPGFGWLLYPWAMSVGCARVILGVHFPSDIIAGAVIGHSISLFAIHIATAF